MNESINITDRTKLRNLLLSLDLNTIPLWGKMNARQMIEHLVEEVKWANGKKTCTCDRTEEEAAKSKQVMIYTDAPIPKNVVLEELPKEFLYPDKETAINQLMIELDDLDHHFKQPGIITTMHGGFGPLNYQEWLIWHSKHFTHHLRQFKLLVSKG